MARPCRESAGFAPASCARAPSDPCRAPASSSDHIHLIAAVQLFDLHVHAIAWARLDRFPDDIGLNRQLAAAAVHQDAEGNPFGAAEVRQLHERHGHTLQRPRHRAGVEERGAFFHFWGPRHLEAETYTYAYTGVKGGLPLSTLCTFAIAIAAILRRISSVALPIWGNNTVRG